MDFDDEICLCYHVSLRKLIHFARRERPAAASGMSECLGAGTGCGWCIPTLRRIHAAALAAPDVAPELPASPDEYAAARQEYILQKKPRNTF